MTSKELVASVPRDELAVVMDKVMERCEKELLAEQYAYGFRSLQQEGFANGYVVFSLPNLHLQRRFEEKHKTLLKRIFSEEWERDVEVCFILRQPKPKARPNPTVPQQVSRPKMVLPPNERAGELASARIMREVTQTGRELLMKDVTDLVAEKTKITTQQIMSGSRHGPIVRARQLSAFIGKQVLKGERGSFKAIGRHFNQDHSTVMNSTHRVPNVMRRHPDLKLIMKEILAFFDEVKGQNKSRQQ